MKETKKHKERREALQILFAKEFHHAEEGFIIDADGVLENEFIKSLVEGVLLEQSKIDEALQKLSKTRALERLNTVNLIILRMAIYELAYKEPKVAPPVVINEAIELSREYSGDTDYKFVHAVLDSYVKEQGL